MDYGRPQSSRESNVRRSFGHVWYQAQRDNEQRCPGDGKPTLITILPWSLAVGVFNCSVHVFFFFSETNIWFVHDGCSSSCFGLPWFFVIEESVLAFHTANARNRPKRYHPFLGLFLAEALLFSGLGAVL